MTKVVIVGPVYPFRGGISHYTTMLAKNLQATTGFQVNVVSFSRQYPKFLYPGETDQDTSQQPMSIPADYLLDPIYPWTWFRAANRVWNQHPDLVIIQWWTTFWSLAYTFFALWLRMRGIHVIYQIHNVMPHEPHFWDIMLTRLALGNAKQFIVLSEKEANRLRKLFPKGEIVVTSIPEYEFSTKNIMLKNQARARLDITMDEQVLLFFGIVRPYKGLRYLLEAVKILCSSCPKIHLIVAGEFWEPKSLYDQLIENLELRDHVSIYNYYIPNEEVPVFFSAADLFVAPYVNGTQSGAIKLALGYGLPVVLTNCIMEEQLKDREDIWQAKEHDVTSLSTAIYNALEERSKNQDIHLTKTKTNKDWESFVKILGSL